MITADMDQYRLDSHKLMYHVARVHDWLENRLIYPIYLEVSPSGACNHRCTFCAKDFMGYRKVFLKTESFLERLREMGALGIKSIMYAGEGEPFLHPDIDRIVIETRRQGIDVAFTTNGVLLDANLARTVLPHCEWIKVSINAGSAETYGRVHRTDPADFQTVLDNIAEAVRIRKEQQSRCTIGMQILLLPENRGEVVQLARVAREIGADYLVIKPYSQHLKSRTERYKDILYQDFPDLAEELSALDTEDFSAILRARTMQKWDQRHHRGYDHCQALPFWAYVDARGNVWGCSSFLLEEQFRYGNLCDQSFRDIWEGEKRRRLLRNNEAVFSSSACRANCRMDEVNRYLWELRHPPAHLNFI